MKREELAEIQTCLPDRITFPYFKDRYALMLLADYVGDGKSVAEVKASRFGRLLNRPGMKPLLSAAGDGMLDRWLLESHWPQDYRSVEAFSITLGSWGGEKYWSRSGSQMARRGYNLVLQLNFSPAHDHPFRKLVARYGIEEAFHCAGHPVNEDGRKTLAWARLDLDFTTGEVLIEEIQTDWLRRASLIHKQAIATLNRDAKTYSNVVDRYEAQEKATSICRYMDEVLKPFRSFWSEAVLMAAIWFARRELGMHRLFMYEYGTGNLLKGLEGQGRVPPKSLYTSLPKSFCMDRQEGLPGFLEHSGERALRRMTKGNEPVFWRMAA